MREATMPVATRMAVSLGLPFFMASSEPPSLPSPCTPPRRHAMLSVRRREHMLRGLALVAMVAQAAIGAAADRPAAPASERLEAALASTGAGGTQAVWVFLRDRAGAPPAVTGLSPRALSRRQVRGSGPLVTDADRPLSAAYVEQLTRDVTRVRHASRWLNAVSVDATPAQVAAVRALPFVEHVDLVARFGRRPESESPVARASSSRRARALVDYGPSLGQLAQIGVPDLHAIGLSGE